MEKRKLFLAFLCALVSFSLASAGLFAPPLDGTSWKITVTPDESAMKHGETAFLDTIFFVDGKLIATVGMTNGFGGVQYKEEYKKSVTSVTGVLQSVKRGMENG